IDAFISGDGEGQVFSLSLWTNSGGSLGTLLGSWSNLAANVSGFGNAGAPVSVSGLTDITLSAGGQYFLEASAEGANAGFWYNSTNGNSGPTLYVDYDYLTQYPQGAFALQGTPAADTGSVPEPASWALMLGGFGLVGGVLRSSRKASVTFA
ncbi:MAG TPA: PEPxxWA-CTERM sorting domain-containing protein, partial [Sphingomonas sp.]|uniref:PEPxxWA-CTERM sorting domain-containing protein n=1 Tax=Sphingomonas sp. TaxID=28214 RepID=UPI002BF0DF27